MAGFLPVQRQIMEHWTYKDIFASRLWFHMLLVARYSPEPHTDTYNGTLVTLNRGEFVFGRERWVEELQIPEQRMKTLLKKFIKENMIELRFRYPKGSVYFLKNYQKFNQQSNQQETLEPQEIEVNAIQQSNQQLTSNHPATNQKRIKKESNNEINTDIKCVYDYWNMKKIKIHKEFTESMRGHVNARLIVHGLQTILDSIDAYHEIINDSDKYWYSHKFTLTEFMNPKNLDRFLVENDPFGSHTKQLTHNVSKTSTSYTSKKENIPVKEVEPYFRPVG